MELIQYEINGLNLVFGFLNGKIKLLHFSKAPFVVDNLCRVPGVDDQTPYKEQRAQFIDEAFQLVQINFAGYNRPYEKHGNKHIVTAPGYMLRFVSIKEETNSIGDLIKITQADDETGAEVITSMQFYGELPIARMTNTVTNKSNEIQTVEYISSFAYTGIEKEHMEGSKEFIDSNHKMSMVIPHHGWQKELSLKKYRFPELGLANTQPNPKIYQRTSKIVEITNTGNWSAKNYLPMGYIGNSAADTGLFFEIDHSGSWHYEVSDQNRMFYVCVSGPTEVQSHWFKNLAPNESFTTVPVAVGVSHDDFEEAISLLTQYRRMIRRPNKDNEKLPVIFNDYMNCLYGDPTTEKEIPLIDAAKKAGCEYYVIDAGWYGDGDWWDSVGEWRESKKRFPNGLSEVTDYIVKQGMVPGLWLELEVMGICCKKADILPDECFFLRHGKRVFDRSRYQLDFRHPLVIQHVNEVIDRVVKDYQVGYIKMDYNIEPGIGTEVDAESVGQGLLAHERAYLEWVDDVYRRYPDLVIENCSSGGLRMDYAMLSRHSIQSTSDQEDYTAYATIAANNFAGVTPEQAAVWSYPLKGGTTEECVYNMVNAMLGRIHQSGHLAEISEECFGLIQEGITTYKTYRKQIKNSTPFWPLGFADNEDKHLAAGLRLDEETIILAVWRRGGESSFSIPLDHAFGGSQLDVQVLYPEKLETDFSYNDRLKKLTVCFPEKYMARLFIVTNCVKAREFFEETDCQDS